MLPDFEATGKALTEFTENAIKLLTEIRDDQRELISLIKEKENAK
jgi:hypothetical protein